MSDFADPIAWEATLPIRPSSVAWSATVRAIYGTKLDDDEHVLFRELSGGLHPPEDGAENVLVVAGRRGGKTETMARVACFEALHGGHQVALAPGQVGLVMVVAPLRDQAAELVRYVRGLSELPQLRRRVTARHNDGVTFATGIRVQIVSADAVAVAGPTVVLVLIDEAAKLPGDESVMPDREIIASLRPALAPVVGAPRRRFVMITSAFLREGVAFETDRDCHGREDAPTLVLRGSTQLFNPNIDRAWLERERKRIGECAYSREYECAWQDAVAGEGWFDGVVEHCVQPGRAGWPPPGGVDGTNYVLSIDPAFKSDRFALAIVHAESANGYPVFVVDALRAWKAPKRGTVDVDAVVAQIAGLVHRYNTGTSRCGLYGDQSSATTLGTLFRQQGVHLVERPWTSANKGPNYRLARDAMAAGRVRLPDDDELRIELGAIRSRQLRSGGQRIEAHRGRDDLADAVVLGIAVASEWYALTQSVERGGGRATIFGANDDGTHVLSHDRGNNGQRPSRQQRADLRQAEIDAAVELQDRAPVLLTDKQRSDLFWAGRWKG